MLFTKFGQFLCNIHLLRNLKISTKWLATNWPKIWKKIEILPEIKGKWPIFQFFITFLWNRYRLKRNFEVSIDLDHFGSHSIRFWPKTDNFLKANSFWIWPKKAICFYFFWTIKLKIIFWEENTRPIEACTAAKAYLWSQIS